MRPVMPSFALAFALTVAVALPGGISAKNRKHTPCSDRFVVDPHQSPLVTNATSTGVDALDVAGKQVTVGGTCTARGSLRATSNGWRVQVQCGPKARLRATISFDCKTLVGKLRAKRLPGKTFEAHPSHCGDGVIDPVRNEQCDPPGASCGLDCRRPTPTTSTTTLPATPTTTLPIDCDHTADNAYTGTWHAIQQTIFVRHDCANDLCHGSLKQGGLDLRPDVAYGNVVEAQSTEVPSLNRVEPGDDRRSYFWLKLLAKTDPARLPSYL